MSGQRRRSKQRRGSNSSNRQQQRTAPPAEFWRTAPEPAEPPDIVPAREPGSLVRSMGVPPLPGQGAVALPYIEAVVRRAADLATALAASADLLETDGPDDRLPG
jgi:hypothetical protein